MDNNWYIELNGQYYGPYSSLQLQQLVQNNQLSPQSFVRSAQDGSYQLVQNIIQQQNPSAANGIPPMSTSPGMPSVNAVMPQQPMQAQPMTPQYANQQQAPDMPRLQTMPDVQPKSEVQPNVLHVPVAKPMQEEPAFVLHVPQPGVQPMPLAQPGVQPMPLAQPGVQPMPPAQPGVQPALQQQAPDATPLNGASIKQPLKLKILSTLAGIVGDAVNDPQSVGTFKQCTMTMRDWIDRGNIEKGEIVCPHCWGRCSLETVLFISSHPELVGDPLLGPDAPRRFQPSYFTEKGTAFDARGMECTDMACPHCHLKIPNSVIDLQASIYSIVGAPSSGKSYFLTSMIWQLRKCLPKYFNFSMSDTDPTFNMVLNNYERILFLNSKWEEYVALPKTELQGMGFSNQIIIENSTIDLPRPFVFNLSPLPTHPRYENGREELERSIVLYDNAGEHFEPGRDSAANLATVHLVHSDGIIFLYDPLKDIRLRQNCSQDDPQIAQNTANVINQMTIFTEMTSRVHKYSNLKANEKFDKPLIVVIPKYDAWKEAFPLDIANMELFLYDDNMQSYLNLDTICAVSFCLRDYLQGIAPEVVGLAEGFSQDVYFVPVSALGRMPEFDASKSMIGIKPDHISPIWAEVPFLLLMYLNGILPGAYSSDTSIPYVTQYKFTGNGLNFIFPDTTERNTVPSFYCGKNVYCRETGKYYRLPDIPEEQQETEDDSTNGAAPSQTSVEDDDFWKN